MIERLPQVKIHLLDASLSRSTIRLHFGRGISHASVRDAAIVLANALPEVSDAAVVGFEIIHDAVEDNSFANGPQSIKVQGSFTFNTADENHYVIVNLPGISNDYLMIAPSIALVDRTNAQVTSFVNVCIGTICNPAGDIALQIAAALASIAP